MTGASRPKRRPRNERRRERARAAPGPGLNLDLMDRCAMLRIEGRSWAQIARSARVGYSTLMEWRLLPQWEDARLRILSALPEALLYKARRVYDKRLDYELTRKAPDVAIAREVVSWYDERLFRGGLGGKVDDSGMPQVTGGVILLPLGTQGQASRPVGEVLSAAGGRPAPRADTAPPKAAARPPKPRRRRVVMEE